MPTLCPVCQDGYASPADRGRTPIYCSNACRWAAADAKRRLPAAARRRAIHESREARGVPNDAAYWRARVQELLDITARVDAAHARLGWF